MFTIEQRSIDSLRAERKRLMYDIDSVEQGETVCLTRIYIKMLTRLQMVDIEITRRERKDAMNYERSIKTR